MKNALVQTERARRAIAAAAVLSLAMSCTSTKVPARAAIPDCGAKPAMSQLPMAAGSVASVLPLGRTDTGIAPPPLDVTLVVAADDGVVPVRAPADGVVTEMRTTRDVRLDRFRHAVVIALCRDVFLTMSDLTLTDDRLLSGGPGACTRTKQRIVELEECVRSNVGVKLEAGADFAVTSGQTRGLSLAVTDRTLPAHTFANPAVVPTERRFARCPLEYFAASQKMFLTGKLRGDSCGEVQQDVPGALTGQWRAAGSTSSDVAIFFGHDGSRRKLPMVWSIPGMGRRWRATGPAFSSIVPGRTACLALEDFRGATAGAMRVQLIDPATLTIRYLESCPRGRPVGAATRFIR